MSQPLSDFIMPMKGVFARVVQLSRRATSSIEANANKTQPTEKLSWRIVTTGVTGFSPRDVTPEATLEVCEKLAQGIPEAMRALSMQITRRERLSPAVAEYLDFILPELRRGIEILRGDDSNCAR